MILFSVMFSMFLLGASSLFVHTLLYMSSLSISPPPSLRLCLPPRGRRISLALSLFSILIESYQTANLNNISKLSKYFNVKVLILFHFA